VKIIILSIIVSINYLIHSQQTVGLFSNTINSYNGYTLFSPTTSTNCYLIDNCGEKVHSWVSSYRPGQSVYLLENGNLLRTQNRNNTTFTSGGTGGGIEILDWNSNIVWDHTISSSLECQHHDIEYLPNGNILAIVWDSKTSTEATQAGRETSGNTLWSEKIVEIQPDLVNGGGTIVWEWKVWDHLIQDFDNSKDNYGIVGDAPELVNINFVSGNATNKDWLHINSIAYNEEFDQIILSNHNFSELWIIDHSTTTAEAAAHSGGTYNKGGDILYRWGNPRTYNQGNFLDQFLYGQHNAYWIEDSLTDGGMIMTFNNDAGSPIDYSEINTIDPPVDSNGNYAYSGGAYSPIGFHWTYQATNATDFYSKNISGAQRLANGNTIICEGATGRFFEVDYSGNIVWEYINPVGNSIIAQGNTPLQNSVFRCTRYATDYPGLSGQSLTPLGYIESGSTFTCDLYVSMANNTDQMDEISVYPNPANDKITISSPITIDRVFIYSTTGTIVYEEITDKAEFSINTYHLSNGLYLIELRSNSGQIHNKKLLIRSD